MLWWTSRAAIPKTLKAKPNPPGRELINLKHFKIFGYKLSIRSSLNFFFSLALSSCLAIGTVGEQQ